MSFINRIKKRRAIKSYVKKLPRLLAKDYGRSAYYRPLQIKRTIERADLDVTYSCYAVAMFSLRDEFFQFHTDVGEICDYDAMRAEVSVRHFSGDENFTVDNIWDSFSEHKSEVTHVDSHGSGDGHGHGGH